jgi:class 3 adenylate cyclase/tetratricopeptide (TPR) repeat protein
MSDLHQIRESIASLQMQRRILGDDVVDRAVAALEQQAEALERERHQSNEAERKHVTVIFADVSGFTSLSETGDAEDIRNWLNACFSELAKVTARYGGYIDKFIGDEMMVLFGAPRAIEDHAARALRAALDMRLVFNEFCDKRKLHADVNMHFGINSGVVIAGAMGADDNREYTVMGDAVNVAARLAARAEAGQILVGGGTAHIVGDAFAFRDLGSMELEGRVGSVPVLELDEARETPSVPAESDLSLGPLVGREWEIHALQEVFDETVTRRCARSVTIVGLAGIGKSRIVREFHTWIQAEHPDTLVVQGEALPHMVTTPYFTMASVIRNGFRLREGEAIETIRRRLGEVLAVVGIDDDDVLVGLQALVGAEVMTQEVAPHDRKAQVFAACTKVLRELAMRSRTAVIVVFEDLHWADDLSLELIEHLMTNLATMPVLFLMTMRPLLDDESKGREFELRLKETHIRIALKELDQSASQTLVRTLIPAIQGSRLAVDAIVRKGQGNPFFIEAIIGSLLDRGVIAKGADQRIVERSVETADVPDTVWAVLAERIDRLSHEEKRVVQMASIVGRSFWEGLVHELSALPAGKYLQALNQREFVDRLGPAAFANDWEWTFKHVLVQEVAYSGLLRETRRAGHSAAAAWLDQRLGAQRQEYSTLLVYHYERAENWDKTAEFAEAAGDRAVSLFAHREAKNSYIQAIDALARLPSSDDVSRRRIDVTLKLADVTFYAPMEDVHKMLTVAEELAKMLADPERKLRVGAALASWLYVAGKNAAAVQLAEQCVASAGEDFEELLAVPLNIIGRTEFANGNFPRCIEFLQRSRNITQRVREQRAWAEGPGQLQGFLGLAYALSGEIEKGENLILDGLALSETNNDLRRIAAGHMYFSIFRVATGKLDGVRHHLQEAIRLSEETGDATITYVCLGYLGAMHALQDELQEAAEYLDRSIAIATELDTKAYVPLLLAFRAEVDLRAGRFESALNWAKRAVEAGRRTTEALRLLGWALHFSTPNSRRDAEAAFQSSADLARKGGALVFYVRTISDYAAYLRIVGDDAAAAPLEREASSIIRERGLTTMPIRPPVPPGLALPSR